MERYHEVLWIIFPVINKKYQRQDCFYIFTVCFLYIILSSAVLSLFLVFSLLLAGLFHCIAPNLFSYVYLTYFFPTLLCYRYECFDLFLLIFFTFLLTVIILHILNQWTLKLHLFIPSEIFEYSLSTQVAAVCIVT